MLAAARIALILAEIPFFEAWLASTDEALAHPWTDTAGRTRILILIRDLTVLCRTRSGPGARTGYGGLVGADPVMTALYDLIEGSPRAMLPSSSRRRVWAGRPRRRS